MLQDAQVTEEQEELLQLQVGLAKCVDTSEIVSTMTLPTLMFSICGGL